MMKKVNSCIELLNDPTGMNLKCGIDLTFQPVEMVCIKGNKLGTKK